MKIIFRNFLLLLLIFSQNAYSKPIPPGSGEGDVPANILILLDSSDSMKRTISSSAGESMNNSPEAVFDSDGNLIVSQWINRGPLKFLESTGLKDPSFANNRGRFRGTRRDNCLINGPNTDSRVSKTSGTDLATNVRGAVGTDIIYMRAFYQWKIIGLTNDGNCAHVIRPGFRPRGLEVRSIGGEDILFAYGRNGGSGRFFVRNLTTGDEQLYTLPSSSLRTVVRSAYRMTVDNTGSFVYLPWSGNLYGYPLTRVGNIFRPANMWTREYRHGTDPTSQLANVTAFDISPEDDNKMYVVSSTDHVIQRLTLTGDTTLTVDAYAGTRSGGDNTEDAGSLAADDVRLDRPWGIDVTATRILVADKKSTIQEFNEDLFTAANRDTAWLNEYGGKVVNRWVGARNAIRAVVGDSALTSGAHFGYGHWNSGESGGRKRSFRGGWECHRWRPNCDYYRGWDALRNRSALCNTDSCLQVPISPTGFTEIPSALADFSNTAWGTDGNAFSQMALEYFTDDEISPLDPNSDCQLNYVIVIGDGNWMHRAQTEARIQALRQDHGVRTLVVAYGGGINAGGMVNFRRMARIGSCDTAGDQECEPLIVANTPSELKTQLSSRIQQIIAERLSFTAPSITATIQKGGSLYQAQFNYEQHGEWQGTILRKTLNADGTVNHDVDALGNWDAGAIIQGQAAPRDGTDERNIWSPIQGVDYVGNWDNFNKTNRNEIIGLFDLMEHTVMDYHNTTSTCATQDGVADGTDDDVDGLLDFMRGVDYFDYNSGCNIQEVRPHVLGDIYHSQIVEIGTPNASTDFTNTNEESYWRSINNYQAFKASKQNRTRIIYAGSNSGMLHAINADPIEVSANGGREEWAFVPPFIAGKLPTIINAGLDGRANSSGAGGTNPIFGVDGSPVVHDVFIRGLNQNGEYEGSKSWHTILIIPYGRGGAGFSVLDVTNPLVSPDRGPLHMFSIFNDPITSTVYVADKDGNITEHGYERSQISIDDSREARQARQNQLDAEDSDGADCDSLDGDASTDCTATDLIVACQTQADFSPWYSLGTSACYSGNTFTFELDVPTTDGTNVDPSTLHISQYVDGFRERLSINNAQMTADGLVITFNEVKTYSESRSFLRADDTIPNPSVIIQSSCEGSGTEQNIYDYSQLGETWSTPRIFRIPSPSTAAGENINNDRYVAVMGGGMGSTFICTGSNVYIVDLEDQDNPGSIYGADINDGPITIVDTDPSGIMLADGTIAASPNGSDIPNALPSSPVVITPDSAFGIPWRGAMVYFNDLEGKITKINLTNDRKNGAEMFDQTTLFRLNATMQNGRLSYHSLEAGIGTDTNQFFLFGGTGDYQDIGGGSDFTENVLYGIKDHDYPHFKHLNGVNIPRETDPGFITQALSGAEKSKSLNSDGTELTICDETTDGVELEACRNPDRAKDGWFFRLDKPELGNNQHIKLSATPTLYKGKVYYPIYQPAPGADRCNLGRALICSADDECGENNSEDLVVGNLVDNCDVEGAAADCVTDACYFVRHGILSELVIFGDTLYANVAGPSATEETLVSILAGSGEVISNRGSWRESGN